MDLKNYKISHSPLTAKSLINSTALLARAQWTEHKSKSALQTIDSAEKILKGSYPIGDLYFLKSRLMEEKGDIQEALRNLELASTEKNAYFWNQGWLYFKNDQFKEALDMFKKIEATETADTGKRSQGLFWQAQSLKKLNQDKEAEKKFQQIINEDPFGYYGFLSYWQLNKRIPSAPSSKIYAAHPPSDFNSDLFHWLTSVGEFPLAQTMLNETLPLKEAAVQTWQDILPLYLEARNYAPAFYKISKQPIQERTKLTLNNFSLMFPTTYLDIIESASHNTGLWTEYILSIIRQESSFDPLSQSPANALGLMQLLPNVAQKISKMTRKQDLFDPSINIELGTRHIRNYYNHSGGNFIVTTASYNASPEAVKKWMKTRYNANALVFIEDIPYEETRNYVKLVMRNFINYLRITSSEDTIAFPQWCLKMP